jgi:hypothetical protein
MLDFPESQQFLQTFSAAGCNSRCGKSVKGVQIIAGYRHLTDRP